MAKRARTKRANGEGSIFRAADGRWKASVTVGWAKGQRKRRTKLCRSHADAVAWVRQMQDGAVASSAMSVSDWLRQWLDGIEKRVRPNTYESYRLVCDYHIADTDLGGTRLSSLTTEIVEAFLGDLDEAGTGSRTRENVYVVLRQALTPAVKKGLIVDNPCTKEIKPKHRRKDIFPFTPREMSAVMRAAKGTRNEALIALAFGTGMRQGEMFGLHWPQVNLSAGMLSVIQQATEVKGIINIEAPKTEHSIRDVPIPSYALEALRRHRVMMEHEGHGDCELVFPTREGTVTRRNNFRRRHWQPLLSRAKVTYRGMHHTRHTFATLALRAGVPITVVSAVLGHSSPSITLDIYSHCLPDDRHLAGQAIEQAISG